MSKHKKSVKAKNRNVIKINKYLLLIFINVWIITVGCLLGAVYSEEIVNFFRESSQNQNEVNVEFNDLVLNCKDDALVRAVNCLTDEVYVFYKYTVTDDTRVLSFDELKTLGGDCKDWSEFYSNAAVLWGYDYQYIYLDVNENERHQYVVVSDETGYCNIDGIYAGCFTFKYDKE